MPRPHDLARRPFWDGRSFQAVSPDVADAMDGLNENRRERTERQRPLAVTTPLQGEWTTATRSELPPFDFLVEYPAKRMQSLTLTLIRLADKPPGNIVNAWEENMFHRSLVKLAAAGAVSAGLVTAGAALAQDVIKVGAIAPKTGPLAGGAVVTQWPNINLWVEQVNARGGLEVGGKKMPIELIEYDDKTNPGEHIKLAQRLAEQDNVDFVVAPYGTGFNIAAAPIYGRYGYPMVAVSAITDKMDELVARYPNLFFTLGTTTAFVEGVRDILVEQRDAGAIGNEVAMVNVADAFGIELADRARELFTEAGFELVYDKSYPLGTPGPEPGDEGREGLRRESVRGLVLPAGQLRPGRTGHCRRPGRGGLLLGGGHQLPVFQRRLWQQDQQRAWRGRHQRG